MLNELIFPIKISPRIKENIFRYTIQIPKLAIHIHDYYQNLIDSN